MGSCVLDVKSGKVMPWTAIQTAAYSLMDVPAEFTEDGHKYTLNGVTLPSVTGILLAEGFIDASFYTEHGRTRGTYVHTARHLDDAGELDESTVDPVIAPYLAAWRAFKRESGFIIEKSEVPMASSLYLYGGKPDLVGHFQTGNIKRGAVELRGNGKYRLVPFNDRQDCSIWLAALSVYTWKNNHGRRT